MKVKIRFFVDLEHLGLMDEHGRDVELFDVVGEFIAETNESIEQLIDAVQSEIHRRNKFSGQFVHSVTEQELRDEPQKLAEYRVRVQLFSEKWNKLSAEQKLREPNYPIRYLQLMARQLGIEDVSGESTEDAADEEEHPGTGEPPQIDEDQDIDENGGHIQRSWKERLQVDQEKSIVTLDEEPYALTGDNLLMIKILLEADGDWVAMRKHGISTPIRIKKSLPSKLQDIIETSSGKGYRLCARTRAPSQQ